MSSFPLQTSCKSERYVAGARVAGALLGAILLCGAAPALIPDQDTPVIDAANVLDADSRRQLVDLLHELKEQTGTQIKVLTVPSLGGEDIFSVAQRQYDLWKLGRKGENKGALIVLAPVEHKVRIQTGYGLEGVLPDSWCGTAERSVAQKYFVRREYSQGLIELTQAVARRVADDAKVQVRGLPASPPRGAGRDFDPTLIIISVLVLVYLFNLYRQWKNRGNRQWGHAAPGWGWSTFPSGRSSGGDWSGGSGGSWSNGGSDFGGGGSSGGGGASASW